MRTARSLLLLGLVALGATATSAHAQVKHEYNYRQVQGQLATRPLYPAARADSVHRAGFNGRLWIGRPIVGGLPETYPLGWGDPGPGAYGAGEYDFSSVHARVGQTIASFSPWEYVKGRGLRSLEMSRQKWLDERGYTGGVRTFVNDLHVDKYLESQGVRLSHAETAEPEPVVSKRSAPEPRATIHMPDDQPRFKSRMQVQRTEPAPAAVTSERPEALVKLARAHEMLQFSWPPTASVVVRAKSEVTVTAGVSAVIRPAAEVAAAKEKAKQIALARVADAQPQRRANIVVVRRVTDAGK
jgi:hypothetical protein